MICQDIEQAWYPQASPFTGPPILFDAPLQQQPDPVIREGWPLPYLNRWRRGLMDSVDDYAHLRKLFGSSP